MAVAADAIRELRQRTGVSILECKKVLEECGGDLEKAVDALRKRGYDAMLKRADRRAAEGLIDSYIHIGGKVGVIVEVNCETDFVSRNMEFQAFVKDIAMQIAAQNPRYLVREEVPETIIQHEREVLRAQAQTDGKKSEEVEKIIDNRLEKFYSEICLLDQPFIKDAEKTIKDHLAEFIGKIGENIVIRRFSRYQVGEVSN